jgi:hypothetical protein
VRLEVDTSGENTNPSSSDGIELRRWPNIYAWVLNKIIDNNTSLEVIDYDLARDKMEEALKDIYKNVERIDPVVFEQKVKFNSRSFPRYLYRGTVIINDDVLILIADSKGDMFIISDNKTEVEQMINDLVSNVSNISEIASDFGLEIDLFHGEELAEELSSTLDADVVRREQFDNDLEIDIYNELRENITSSLDDNVVLRFGDDDPEIFEYDILIHLNSSSRIVIEIKDASHDEANLGKSHLINKPRDKKDIIDAEESERESERIPLQTRETFDTDCFVIVKGIDNDKFKQHKQKAERRGVNILRYDDDGTYLNEIEKTVKSVVTRESI